MPPPPPSLPAYLCCNPPVLRLGQCRLHPCQLLLQVSVGRGQVCVGRLQRLQLLADARMQVLQLPLLLLQGLQGQAGRQGVRGRLSQQTQQMI